MTSQPQDLTTRLTAINLVATGVAILLASLALIGVEYQMLRAGQLDDLKVQARIIGDNEASPLVFGDADSARKILDSLSGSPAIQEAAVLDPVGRVVALYLQPGTAPAPAAEWPESGHRFCLHDMHVVQPVELDGQQVGTIRLRADMIPLYRRLMGYAGITLAISLGALLTAHLLIARMRRTVSRAERRLHYLAHTDPVTRLPNRYSFNVQLAYALARVRRTGGSLALLMLDLDNFKLVNDTFGHPSGDALLAEVARRLERGLRQSDFVCRLGGDEFAVIVEHADDTLDVAHIAQKLQALLCAPYAIDGHEVFLSTSIGISFAPDDTEDPDDLIRNADTALYAAKARGKNAFELFAPAMNEVTKQRLSLESQLRRALEREEFVLHYQPQIELASGRVVGAEALVRWLNPERGLVPPGEFIPLAEENGLIAPIGAWVLREACAQAVLWRADGLPPQHMAVNVSARQLDQDDLAATVLEVLDQTGLTADQLDLEITESGLMSNAEANARVFQALSDRGVKLAIDDFGTGYSSMSYLRLFPIDQLKIDRSFVTGLPGSRDERAIVAATIAMAHSLGIRVIAEGVETREQYDALRELGCDMVQGYLISRPLPAAEYAAFLMQREAVGSE